MTACAKFGKKFGFFSDKYNSEMVYDEFRYKLTLNAKLFNNPYRGKNLCVICYQEVYDNAPSFLLQCKNASLTNKEFYYKWFANDYERIERWLITDLKMAMVEDDGSLGIIFNDGTKEIFKISADVSKADVAGLVLFGGIGSMIAGNMALKNQKIANTQRWATTINVLISKGTLPEMIFCRYCGTKNKSEDSKCVHCGAILT